MAEMFIGHMCAMAGVFAASTAVWFSIRGSRKMKGHEENRIEDVTKGETE